MIPPRGIVPLVKPKSAGVAAPSAQLVYQSGGTVLGAVEVVPIYWGAYWSGTEGAALSAEINGFFDFILTSSLMDMLAEYSTPTTTIGRGVRLPSVQIADSEPGDATSGGREVTDSQIQTALQSWIANGKVPAVTSNTLYFIYLPPNVTAIDQSIQSCQDFCGYHNQINMNVFYAVQPYATCSGCSFGTILDSITKISSHELCESITDPALNAWADPTTGEEIGDICNDTTARLGGYLIQLEWSNSQNACALKPASAGASSARSQCDDRQD
jgi:hypothetical protein